MDTHRGNYDVSTVQSADPLNADDLLRVVPTLNASGDVSGLIALLRMLSDRTRSLIDGNGYSPPERLAIVRDVGILLGSIKRHGMEPLVAVPELTHLLVRLGRESDLVPRDTVHHYTSWNPQGDRRRAYTGDPQEAWLQDAVRLVFPDLSASLAITEILLELDPRDARFAPTARQLTGTVRSMLDAIESVTERVSPVFFARVLRPYFEDVNVNGTSYLGPAAAQAPLWLIDLCLWASDRNSEVYAEFVTGSLKYALPDWREFYQSHRGGRSIVTILSESLQRSTRDVLVSRTVEASISEITKLLWVLKAFRGRHLTIAKKAYAEDVRLYETGSGGAPIALLKEILDLTRANELLLKPSRAPATTSVHA